MYLLEYGSAVRHMGCNADAGRVCDPGAAGAGAVFPWAMELKTEVSEGSVLHGNGDNPYEHDKVVVGVNVFPSMATADDAISLVTDGTVDHNLFFLYFCPCVPSFCEKYVVVLLIVCTDTVREFIRFLLVLTLVV